jgi:hypothetical protein
MSVCKNKFTFAMSFKPKSYFSLKLRFTQDLVFLITTHFLYGAFFNHHTIF